MKFALLLTLLIVSSFSFAAERASNILATPSVDCASEEGDDRIKLPNLVTFEKIIKLEDGSYWVSNIHLKSDSKFFRVADSNKNKTRICKDLGFSSHGGSRVEFDRNEKVIVINSKLEIVKEKKSESKFIMNVNCYK